MKKVFLYKLILGIGCLLLDQISKYLALSFFSEKVVLNFKGSWGVIPWWTAILGLIMVLILIFVSKKFNAIISIILFSGISNLIDRVSYKGVVDFIKIGTMPVFNLADVFIVLACVWSIIDGFLKKESAYL